MSGTTRTIGPLHFEDLEPRRFEDLVRQLIYDFRPWRALEATGRSGSDDGFDARGFEIVDSGGADLVDDGDNQAGEEIESGLGSDRIWLIQCKREQAITPSKLRKYLTDMPPGSIADLYGIIFVAASDFSKRTRDEFIRWRLENGISEGYLWGKADLEDQLYQPKNDGLLFAYFGFSLRIRRRSIKTELRSKLAMKRKCERVLNRSQFVLIRDPTDDRYPFFSQSETKARTWRVRRYIDRHYLGVMMEIYSQFAYIADDEKSWDAVDSIRNGVPGEYDDPWFVQGAAEPSDGLQSKAWSYWNDVPERNRANLTVYELIPYESILDIDEKTDGIFNGPTVFVVGSTKFQQRQFVENLSRFQTVKIWADPACRVSYFPKIFPDLRAPGSAATE